MLLKDYVVLDIEMDGQDVPRVLWIEGIKVSEEKQVSNYYAFNFCDVGEESPPSLIFVEDLMKFISGLPIVCFDSLKVQKSIEHELSFFRFDDFNKYFCIKDYAQSKFYRYLSIQDLLTKFDLKIFDRGINLQTNVEDIFNIYEKLKIS
jgi:hypothetical protein